MIVLHGLQFATGFSGDNLGGRGRSDTADARLDVELLVDLSAIGWCTGRAAIACGSRCCACQRRRAGHQKTGPQQQHCDQATHT